MSGVTVDINKLDQFLRTNKNPIRAFLIYGQDEGGVMLTIRKILKLALRKEEDMNNAIERHSYASIASEPFILHDFFNSRSLFTSKSVILIDDCSENINKDVVGVLTEQLQSSNNLVIFSAGDLKKSSKIVKAFESLTRALIIPCYKLDHSLAISFIFNWLQNNNLRYENAVPQILGSLLPLDRMLITNELNKLALYVGGRTITNTDIEEVFYCNSKEASIDLLCQAICDKKQKIIFDCFDSLIKNDYSLIAIVRALQNYFFRLIQVKIILLEGETIQNAILKLNPPLFFKQKDSFSKNIEKLSLAHMKIYLQLFTDIEMEIKKSHSISPIKIIEYMIYKTLQKLQMK